MYLETVSRIRFGKGNIELTGQVRYVNSRNENNPYYACNANATEVSQLELESYITPWLSGR